MSGCGNRSLARRCLLAVAATMMVGAFGAQPASALELGSDLDGPSPVSVNCGGACVLIQDTIAFDSSINVVPDAGRITGFRIKGAAGSVALVVFRDSGSGLQQIGGSSAVSGNGGTQGFTLSPAIPVQENDLLALRLVNGSSSIGADNAGSGSGTRLVQLAPTSPFGETASGDYEMFMSATWLPNPPSTPPSFTPPADDTTGPEPAVAAPDPFAALRAGGRPRGRIFGGTSRMSRRGWVRVKISNPNGYTITGKLTLKSGRSRLGASRFGLGAHKRRYVRVKLTRRARRRLVRRRRMRVVAVMKFNARIGKSNTVRKRIRLKAPPRPRRRSGGGGGGGGGGNGNVCGTPRFGPGYTDINGIFHPGQLNYCPNLFPDLTF